MAILDGHPDAGGPFVCGADFTLADIVLGLSINRWLMTPLPQRPDVPAVMAWFEGVLDMRPAFAVFCRNGTP